MIPSCSFSVTSRLITSSHLPWNVMNFQDFSVRPPSPPLPSPVLRTCISHLRPGRSLAHNRPHSNRAKHAHRPPRRGPPQPGRRPEREPPLAPPATGLHPEGASPGQPPERRDLHAANSHVGMPAVSKSGALRWPGRRVGAALVAGAVFQGWEGAGYAPGCVPR